MSNSGVFKVDFYIKDGYTYIEDKKYSQFNNFLVKYIDTARIISKTPEKVIYRASHQTVNFFITIDSNEIIAHKSNISDTAISYNNSNNSGFNRRSGKKSFEAKEVSDSSELLNPADLLTVKFKVFVEISQLDEKKKKLMFNDVEVYRFGNELYRSLSKKGKKDRKDKSQKEKKDKNEKDL